MINRKIKQFRIINCDNATDFETELNTALMELASHKPEVDVDVKAGYKAFISYEVSKDIPETIAEQFALKGISYQCKDCPHCTYFTKTDGTVDNRKRRAMCEHSEFGVTLIDGDACEKFYKWFADGDIEPIGGENEV